MLKSLIAAATVSAALFAVPAFAQTGTPEQRDACTPDVYRLCQAEIPDETRIVACLKKKVKQLSPACAKVFSDK